MSLTKFKGLRKNKEIRNAIRRRVIAEYKLKQRENKIISHENEVTACAKKILSFYNLLEVKEKKMELKENELKQREQEVNRREQEVKQREQEVKQKEQEVEQWDEELTQWDEELKQFALDAQLMMNNAHSLYNASAGKQQFLNYLGYFLYIKSDVQNRFLQIMIDKLKRQESDFVKCYSEVIGRYRDEIERSHASRAC